MSRHHVRRARPRLEQRAAHARLGQAARHRRAAQPRAHGLHKATDMTGGYQAWITKDRIITIDSTD